MSKSVCKNPSVKLGGWEVRHWVKSWTLRGVIGELNMCELELIDGDYLKIEEDRRERNEYGVRLQFDSARVATNDKILINDTDISSWITGYDRKVSVGRLDSVLLYIQCDREVLSINGGYPWEEMPGQADGLGARDYFRAKEMEREANHG